MVQRVVGQGRGRRDEYNKDSNMQYEPIVDNNCDACELLLNNDSKSYCTTNV